MKAPYSSMQKGTSICSIHLESTQWGLHCRSLRLEKRRRLKTPDDAREYSSDLYEKAKVFWHTLFRPRPKSFRLEKNQKICWQIFVFPARPRIFVDRTTLPIDRSWSHLRDTLSGPDRFLAKSPTLISFFSRPVNIQRATISPIHYTLI
jgi:hypothetical protein